MRVVLAFIGLLIAAGFASAASQPSASKTEYLVSTGAGFMLTGEKGVAYGMSFHVRKPFPGAIYCVALFENPAAPDAPLKKEFSVAADATEIQVQSDGMHVIQNDHRYMVRLMLYLDPGHASLLSEHDQEVLFSMPRNMLGILHDKYGVDVD
ncbi:MAG: hypothetical protein U1F30_10935 [Steroidobacteraceae bacterium]